jgi:CheY-like chemotaxis protein
MPHSSEHAQCDLSVRHLDPLSKPRHESISDARRPVGARHCPVLIVEDDSDLREMMAQLLTLEGFHSATVPNGKEALRYLSGSDTPDVILLDLMMPVMDGWEFRRVQQADPKLARVPTIVLSALDHARAIDLKPAAFLKKPLDFDLLLQLVRQYCH